MRSSPSPIQILKSSVELKNPKKNQGSKFQYFTRIVAIVGKAMRRARAANKDSFMVLHNLLPRLQFGAKNPRRRHQRCKMLSCIRTVRVRSIFESQKYYHGASELLASNINPNLSHYHHGEIGLPVHLTHYNDTVIIPITIFAPFLLKNNIFGIELCLNWSVTAVWPPLSSFIILKPTYTHSRILWAPEWPFRREGNAPKQPFWTVATLNAQMGTLIDKFVDGFDEQKAWNNL